MYLRRCGQSKTRKTGAYWELVESRRTERGPRQRVVSYLGDLVEAARLGVREAALGGNGVFQSRMFGPDPEWVEVDVRNVRVENLRDFGGYWLGLEVWQRLGLTSFLEGEMPQGREEVPWSAMAALLVLMRLCDPSSELRIAEHLYERTALADILGIPPKKVNDDRLYRALDNLLPHKAKLEKHLKERLGQMFDLEYDILMYDITSTYFEGMSVHNDQAGRGYSRDHRPDCNQVCIALVVTRWGVPLGYEVFSGNRADVTTVEQIVKKIEEQYGKADRIWVMDRGMVSEKNLEWLRSEGRRYIVGTGKGQLKRFEKELAAKNWEKVRDGLEVKLCQGEGGDETFILCRSAARMEKEKAIHELFEKRLEEGLNKLTASCQKKRWKVGTLERRVGRLLALNSRARGLFKVDVRSREDGGAEVLWQNVQAWRDWAAHSEGCYLLRSNVNEWKADQLWRAYTQLSEAEAAFRIQKGDLQIRPIWHQKAERVQAHILVCFLAYVLWKTIGLLTEKAGLGNEPRKVLDEIAQIKVVDVILPTRAGAAIKRSCISSPTKYQLALLDRLEMHPPKQLEEMKGV